MNFSLLRRLLVASLALLVPACAADTDDGLPDEDDDFSESVQASTGNLMVAYDLAKPCTIYLNMPGDGVDDNSNWKTTGTYITWRYNMNSEWALVSDPKRAGKTYPWWGFTRRDCIKGEPERIKEGRSNVAASGWRTVQTDVPPASVTVSAVASSSRTSPWMSSTLSFSKSRSGRLSDRGSCWPNGT